MTVRVRDFAERVVFTFLWAAISALLADRTNLYHAPWKVAVFTGLFAAAVSVLTSLARNAVAFKFDDPLIDLVYRVAMTFLQTLAGVAAAAGTLSVLNFDWDGAIQTSLYAAAGALLKALTGLHANTVGASALVPLSGPLGGYAVHTGGVTDEDVDQLPGQVPDTPPTGTKENGTAAQHPPTGTA